jgi:tRNA G18 (ribose-2'-O)-methylase SpoU
MPHLIVIAHNIRSTHNVGSIFRTCEGFGVEQLILTGYTPYPTFSGDTRLPHIRDKITMQIHKTALGAEQLVPFEYHDTLDLGTLDLAPYRFVALEQAEPSVSLRDYRPSEHMVLILGEEVHGITADILSQCHDIVEIPMYGHKESFNVSVAAGIALYELSK